jgi:hypothetical protein
MLPEVFHCPADGKQANVWAGAFEDEVQQLIDCTAWRPPDEFRPLIRHNIKIEGRLITDVDAVAYRDGVLLLIDCKSYKVSDRLAAGEYSAVKSQWEKIEAACLSWMDRIATIDANRPALRVPVGPDTTIAGVVVVPFTPFVLPGPATEEILAGLRRASTVGELLMYFSGAQTGR